MDMDFTVVPLSYELLAQIEGWAATSAQQTLLKLPEITIDPRNLSWVGLLRNEPVAFCTIRPEADGANSIYIIVKPSERRNGIASRLLESILAEPAVHNLSHLQGFVEADNTAAQKLLVKNGFSQFGYNENGLLKFQRR